MALRRIIPAAAVLAFLLVTAAGAAALDTAWKVTSTLDGKKVLPRRIAWIATTPGLRRSGLKSGGIGFLIDGKIADFTDNAPFTYAGAGGYLVTTWLRPGPHTFTVRAHAKDGTVVDDTVTARTVAPAAPPSALVGTWVRTVTDNSGAPRAGSSGNPEGIGTPIGTYKLTVDPRWIQTVFPGKYGPKTSGKTGGGFIIDNDWTPGTKAFRALGGVQFKVGQDIDAEGGWWCNPGGPVANYTWSVSGNTLTLTPGGKDACGVREFIWAGEWKRAR